MVHHLPLLFLFWLVIVQPRLLWSMIALLKTRPVGSFERPGTVELGALLQERASVYKESDVLVPFLSLMPFWAVQTNSE